MPPGGAVDFFLTNRQTVCYRFSEDENKTEFAAHRSAILGFGDLRETKTGSSH
jgi:hypothetical protein